MTFSGGHAVFYSANQELKRPVLMVDEDGNELMLTWHSPGEPAPRRQWTMGYCSHMGKVWF